MAAKYQHQLSDIAHQLTPKMRPAVLKTSFKKFLAVMPEAEDHVELVEETTRGGRCLTYRMDSVALAAFMYWRERRGRLPRIFGVERHVVEGSVNAKP
jgi:hypothetical protein